MIIRKSPDEIEIMREAGRITAAALKSVAENIRPGVTTLKLDAIAEDVIRSLGATPAFKGYHGFPASICASINNEVVHGIPSERRLKEGDILSVDVGAVLDGYHGDCAITFAVGEVEHRARHLMTVTKRALDAGIAKAVVGAKLSDVSAEIQKVAEAEGFGVVREYVGHGIGRSMHEEPQIPNFGPPGQGPTLKAGMVLAIEPMINAGGHEVKSLSDGWTVVTADDSLSAHYEHTVAIHEAGPQVLTEYRD